MVLAKKSTLAGLPGAEVQQPLALDAVAQVEQLALHADAVDRVGPLQAPLLAEDVAAPSGCW